MTHANARLLPPGELLGNTIRRQSVPGAVLAETSYRSNALLPPHSHSAATLFFIVRGHYEERAGERRFSYPSGSFAYNPPHGIHSGAFAGQSCRAFHVELTRDIEVATLPTDRSGIGGGSVHAIGLLLRQLHRELHHADDVQPLAIEGLILQLTAAIARGGGALARAGREESAVQRACDILADARDCVPDWSTVSAELGMSEEVLLQAFRRVVGCSPAAYVRRCRVDAAARKLAFGDAPLSRIALDAGFYDQAHFSRSFKAIFGVSPSAYRKLHRR